MPNSIPLPDESEMNWENYEQLVKDIYLALGRAHGVTIECWGRDCQVKGLTGECHQIDVLTSHIAGIHRYRTAMSCKYWNDKVDRPVVVEFTEILDDARINKGVIVSKLGFTRGARAYAKAKGIGLVELRRPLDRDWEGYIREIRILINLDYAPIYEPQFRINIPRPEGETRDSKMITALQNMRLNQFIIQLPTGQVSTLQEITDVERNRHPDRNLHDIEFPEGSIITVPHDTEYPVHGHKITGFSFRTENVPPIQEELVINFADKVYMIMESIFEGRRYTITNEGKIIENSDDNEDRMENCDQI